MHNKILIIAIFICSSSTFAQSDKFIGTSVGLNTGFNKEFLKLDSILLSSEENTPASINTSYTFSISPSSVLSVGVDYFLTSSRVIKKTDNLSEFLFKDHFSLNIEPGYIVNDKILGYLKLAYHRARAYDYWAENPLNKTISGTGYGVGGKYFFNNKIYLNFEYQNIDYNSFTHADYNWHNQTQLTTIGLGYKF